jgi:hypothetical protein
MKQNLGGRRQENGFLGDSVKGRKEFCRNYLKVVSSDRCLGCGVHCSGAEPSGVIVRLLRVIFEKVQFNLLAPEFYI